MNTSITTVSREALQAHTASVNLAKELGATIIQQVLPNYKELSVGLYVHSRFTDQQPTKAIRKLIDRDSVSVLSSTVYPNGKLSSIRIVMNLDLIGSKLVLDSYKGRLQDEEVAPTVTNLFIMFMLQEVGKLYQRVELAKFGLTERFDLFVQEVSNAGMRSSLGSPETLMCNLYISAYIKTTVDHIKMENPQLATCLDF